MISRETVSDTKKTLKTMIEAPEYIANRSATANAKQKPVTGNKIPRKYACVGIIFFIFEIKYVIIIEPGTNTMKSS